MVHERHHPPQPLAQQAGQSSTQAARPLQRQSMPLGVSGTERDIKALNSSILILTQKINYIVRNEKILGRNILVLNKKLKELESGREGAGAQDFSASSKELEDLTSQVEQLSGMVAELSSAMERLKESSVKAEQFKEIKYVIDSINPLEFVTYKDVEEMIDNKLEGKIGNNPADSPKKQKK